MTDAGVDSWTEDSIADAEPIENNRRSSEQQIHSQVMCTADAVTGTMGVGLQAAMDLADPHIVKQLMEQMPVDGEQRASTSTSSQQPDVSALTSSPAPNFKFKEPPEPPEPEKRLILIPAPPAPKRAREDENDDHFKSGDPSSNRTQKRKARSESKGSGDLTPEELLKEQKRLNARSWRQSMAKMRDEVPRLQNLSDDLKRRKEALEREVEEKNQKIADMEEQIRELHRQNGALQAKCDVLQQPGIQSTSLQIPWMTTDYSTIQLFPNK